MRLLDTGERVIAYLTEQSFIVALSIVIDFAILDKSYLLGFFLSYKLNFVQGVMNVFTTQQGLLDLVILYSISFIYYSLESLTNLGIGPVIFHKRLIFKYSIEDTSRYKLMLGRNMVKAFFLAELINFVFIVAFRKFLQTAYDRAANIVVSSADSDERKYQGIPFLWSSIIMYYSIFGLFLVLYLFVSPVAPTPKGSGSSSFDPYTFFNSILSNNLSLDLYQYTLSGFTLFVGTFINLFNSTSLETVVLSSLVAGSETVSTLKYILPQFVPETLGYVFGISVSMMITDLILGYFQSAMRREKLSYFTSRSSRLIKEAIFFLGISVVLLVIGAVIETWIG